MRCSLKDIPGLLHIILPLLPLLFFLPFDQGLSPQCQCARQTSARLTGAHFGEEEAVERKKIEHTQPRSLSTFLFLSSLFGACFSSSALRRAMMGDVPPFPQIALKYARYGAHLSERITETKPGKTSFHTHTLLHKFVAKGSGGKTLTYFSRG